MVYVVEFDFQSAGKVMLDLIRNRRQGLRFYGLTPPKKGQDSAKTREIAERQMLRIADLAPDGLILYDLQDESGRSGAERPFPFLPTLEPAEFARDYLAALPIPKVLYKCIADMDRAALLSWFSACSPETDAFVLVGSPSGKSLRLTLPDAYSLLRQSADAACLGGVAIAERHHRKGDEDGRLLAKHASGCRFFVSQTIYDASATKSLLSDYALRFAAENLEPDPFILSFSPCGSLKTMEFMKWLGISFPRWLENELRHSSDILAESVDLAVRVFADVRSFALEKGIPIGVNVESVSIRKAEIEASCELFARLSAMMTMEQ